MIRALPILVALSAQVSFGQLRAVPAGPDLDDLYARLAGSDYVVRARLESLTAVASRTPAPKTQVGPSQWAIRIEDMKSASVFTVKVEEVICRSSAFGLASAAEEGTPSYLRLLVPLRPRESGRPSRFDPHRTVFPEYLMPGREYLLFLRELPEQNVAEYKVDLEDKFYRAYDGDRGAVALPDAANPERPYTFVTPLVEAVRAFCEAVKARDADAKISNLGAIREKFPYAAWRESVDAAIGDFQRQKARQSQRQ